jgi:D-tyrosyl-tRNA(Tyr) deacylase
MRVVIQRVSQAQVSVEGQICGKIGKGLLILLAVEEADNESDIAWLCGKITRLRIFDDEKGLMNLSMTDVDADCLVISQFTLYASTRKGNRPSYTRAATGAVAVLLYEKFVQTLRQMTHKPVPTGVFGAEMQVALVNTGPVTIMMDSKSKE